MRVRFVAYLLLLPLLVMPTLAKASAAELPVGQCKLEIDRTSAVSNSFPKRKNALSSFGQVNNLIVGFDFPDFKSTSDPSVITKSLNPDKISAFYSFVSYGKLELKFDIYDKVVTLPKNSRDYVQDKNRTPWDDDNWDLISIYRAIITKIDGAIDLSKYSAIHIVPLDNNKRQASRAFASPDLSEILKFSNGFFQNGSFIGNGFLNRSSWDTLAHEIGHLYGFTDLYMLNGDYHLSKTLGAYDLMNSSAGSTSFIAWHRWLAGWLEDSQLLCLSRNTSDYTIEISSINKTLGKKAVMIPMSTTKILVVESRKHDDEQFYNSNFTDDFLVPIKNEEGLLVYLVDLEKSSGEGPIRNIPEINEKTSLPPSRNFGDPARFQTATLRNNEYVEFEGILLENLKSTSDSDLLRISQGVLIGPRINASLEKRAALKAEADAKAKAEADAKAKAEADAKAKAEAEAKAKAEAEAKAKAKANVSVKKTIVCIKGKIVKKIIAVSPKCPKGYKIR